MNSLAVGLVVVSAVLHALWNAGLRLERDKERGVVLAIFVGSVVALGVAAVIAAWRGHPFAGVNGQRAFAITLAAGVFEAMYFASLARALTLGPLGTVYTLSRGGAMVAVWPLWIAWFGEAVTTSAVIGTLVLLVGLGVASAERGASARAVAWALVCAAFIASYHLAYKAALQWGGEPAAVFAISLSLSSVINVVRLGRGGRQQALALWRARWGRLSLIGLVCAVAFLVFMFALAMGGAGAIVSLRNTSVVFATLLAWRIGDRPSWRQLVGTVLVAGGAILISW